MSNRLFHFSDNGTIKLFQPRPVRVPVKRPKGSEWLNGPLIWAIDEWHQPMYMFPKEYPRILLWRKENTTDRDIKKYFGASTSKMLAYIEKDWAAMLEKGLIHRYELPYHSFISLDDAGMWVSQKTIYPLETLTFLDLPKHLLQSDVELRVIPSLNVLKDAWNNSLHVNGIRLRNSKRPQ